MNFKHNDLTPAAVTGDVPIQCFGDVFGGREDMRSDRAWDGCLDAPDAILLGGCVAVDTGRYEGGIGYEGTTPCTNLRESMQ